MLRWIGLVVAIVGISAAIPIVVSNLPSDESGRITALPAPDAPTGPVGKLLIEGPAKHDFGKRSVGSKGDQPFTIKNVGAGDLTLKLGEKTCQCTVAEFDPELQGKKAKDQIVLKPQESTTINVSWTAKNPGKFEQGVSLESNDPAQPAVWFRITGHAYPPLVTMPEEPIFEFGELPNDKPMPIYLAVSSFDEPSFKIVDMHSTNPELITATQTPLTETERQELKFDSGYKVEITIHPSKELGLFSDLLTIKTDHSGQNELRVPIRGRRTGQISVVPPQVRFEASVAKGGHNTALLMVRGQAATNFEVESTPENVSVRVEPMTDGDTSEKVKRYRVVMDVPSGMPADVIAGDVVLKTDHPTVSMLKIPVQIPVVGGN